MLSDFLDALDSACPSDTSLSLTLTSISPSHLTSPIPVSTTIHSSPTDEPVTKTPSRTTDRATGGPTSGGSADNDVSNSNITAGTGNGLSPGVESWIGVCAKQKKQKQNNTTKIIYRAGRRSAQQGIPT